MSLNLKTLQTEQNFLQNNTVISNNYVALLHYLVKYNFQHTVLLDRAKDS